MDKQSSIYKNYVAILKNELICATGCTEPIAIALASAKARKTLSDMPDKMIINASGNVIKNAKSVEVPNTNNRRGIKVAAVIGIIAGDDTKGLDVISNVTEEQINKIDTVIKNCDITINLLKSEYPLDIIIELYKDNNKSSVRIAKEHTNIVEVKKNNKEIFTKPLDDKVPKENKNDKPDYELLNINDIVTFATECDINDVKEILQNQIEKNIAIAKEGLVNNYGANIGKTLLKTGNDLKTRAKAVTSAASDARMNGCDRQVVICSGSGNQGLTASLPVIEYAKDMNVDSEQLYRSLIVSNLVTLRIKAGIGRLSAFCGAICAGVGAGAGIAYLKTKDTKTVSHTIVNSLAISSGIICDGAKSSCAAKIAIAVETGILGFEMYTNKQEFYDGEGLVVKGVENTIDNFARVASIGMKSTDEEIIHIMTDKV